MSTRKTLLETTFSGRGQAITTKQAAVYTSYSEKTLANWRVEGKGPVFSKAPGPKGAVRYRVADLDDWLDAGRRSSTSNVGGNDAP